MQQSFTVIALYKFVALENYQELREPLLEFMASQSIKGTILLAAEGINGTVAGSAAAIASFIAYLQADPRLSDLTFKTSYCDIQPFYRSKVKLKQEIVKLGIDGIAPLKEVGSYVSPEEWNNLITQPDVLLIDTRNHYEVSIGAFKNAIDPETDTFSQLPEYVTKNLDKNQHKKVAMYCTGGIRCEKSTAYLLSLGFEEVYHLEGGILAYLEQIKPEDSLWEGECFVFDDRVTVDHNLEQGTYAVCHECDQIHDASGKLVERLERNQPLACDACGQQA